VGLLEKIKASVSARRYRVRIHAVRHMIEEGFDEESLLEALGKKSRIFEDYPAEMRCLVLGYFESGEPAYPAPHRVRLLRSKAGGHCYRLPSAEALVGDAPEARPADMKKQNEIEVLGMRRPGSPQDHRRGV
jgi:hypothetical protein